MVGQPVQRYVAWRLMLRCAHNGPQHALKERVRRVDNSVDFDGYGNGSLDKTAQGLRIRTQIVGISVRHPSYTPIQTHPDHGLLTRPIRNESRTFSFHLCE